MKFTVGHMSQNYNKDNEILHKQGKAHLKKLWGIVLCRLCIPLSANGRQTDSESVNERSIRSEGAN